VIVVTTGTNGTPFDRLLSELEHLGAGEPVVVQHGPSTLRPAGARCVDYLSFAELSELITAARVVISHGGAGSVLAARAGGHRPLVVPRLLKFREAVDDHQLWFTTRLAAEGIVTVVEDPRLLRRLVNATTRLERSRSHGAGGLRTELAACLGRVSRAAAI
jgi:UDP-N-acetylglucosamine transferase subunit ALG13